MAEVERPGLLVALVHRKIDDPGEVEPVLHRQPQLLADDVARPPRHRLELRRPPGEEERRVADPEPELRTDRLGSLRPDRLRERTRSSMYGRFPLYDPAL